jgi:hypothetical protein
MSPLILRFAETIPTVSPEILRYDSERQLAQVLVDGNWVDRITVGALDASTRFSKVPTETTDDA